MPKKSKKVRVKKAKGSVSHATARATADTPRTIEEWIHLGDAAFLQQDATRAIALFTSALDRINSDKANGVVGMDSGSRVLLHHILLLEKRAGAKLSLGDQDGAKADYESALKLVESASTPDMLERKAGLFLYVGQLNEGEDALENYQSGIACLQSALARRSNSADADMMSDPDRDDENDGDPKNPVRETRQQLASAYCSVAELYMTDLCFEECAEHECEESITKALNLASATDDDTVPLPAQVDAWQAMANFRLSQKRGLEAVEYILKVYDAMRVGCQSLASLVGLNDVGEDDDRPSSPDEGQASELQNVEDVQRLPGYEFRCQTSKLLLECAAVIKDAADIPNGSCQNCAQAAVDVLGSLLAENDEVVEVWFLVGEAFMAMTPPNREMAEHYWLRSKEMLSVIQESLEQQLASADDEEEEDELQRQLDEVVCQLEDVTSKLENMSSIEEAMDVET